MTPGKPFCVALGLWFVAWTGADVKTRNKEGETPLHLAAGNRKGGTPPPGATVIHTVGRERLPVDWLLHRPSGGRLFVHSGNTIVPFLRRAGVLERFLGTLGRRHGNHGGA